jgi:hypothetical protein
MNTFFYLLIVNMELNEYQALHWLVASSEIDDVYGSVPTLGSKNGRKYKSYNII